MRNSALLHQDLPVTRKAYDEDGYTRTSRQKMPGIHGYYKGRKYFPLSPITSAPHALTTPKLKPSAPVQTQAPIPKASEESSIGIGVAHCWDGGYRLNGVRHWYSQEWEAESWTDKRSYREDHSARIPNCGLIGSANVEPMAGQMRQRVGDYIHTRFEDHYNTHRTDDRNTWDNRPKRLRLTAKQRHALRGREVEVFEGEADLLKQTFKRLRRQEKRTNAK